MKKTKSIPAIVTLLGCAVAAIVTYINRYSLEKTLKIILVVLFIFLFMGLFIKHLFEKYIPPIEEPEPEEEDEGSVIEKKPEDGENGEYTDEMGDEGFMEQNPQAQDENA